MLKNIKQKTTCHSGLDPESSAKSQNNKAYYASGCPIRSGMTGECGRSMVEMLGVLAVIGVLSVAGIAAYSNAMNRHRANELLNEASKRAVVVAGQINMMGSTTPSIGEFDNNEALGFSETVGYNSNNKTFTLTLSNVNADVCNQMKAAVGESSTVAIDGECGSNLTLYFNEDLSKGVNMPVWGRATIDGYDDDDGSTCTGTRAGGENSCQVCVDGAYTDSDAKCNGEQFCLDGTCTPISTSGNGCSKNSDCLTLDSTNCGNGECYCDMGQGVTPAAKNGTCKSAKVENTDYYTLTEANDGLSGILSVNTMNYYTAKNFCAAHGTRLMTFSVVPLQLPY